MGCVPRFETPEQMQAAIDEYFANPPTITVMDKDGNEMQVPKVTISGLSRAIGFKSHQSWYDYKKREGYGERFAAVLNDTKLRIAEDYEFRLQSSNAAGSIFALKNLGWTDRSEVVNTNIEMSHEDWLESLE